MPSSALVTIPEKMETVLLPGDIPLPLVAVQGGTFTMRDDESEYGEEKPAHPVQVKDFYIGQYPITNQQYAAFLNAYGSEKVIAGVFKDQVMLYKHRWGCQNKEGRWSASPGFEHHPVTEVTWHGAHAFCNWLSANAEGKYSLPSESQWEYAAKGGKYSRGFTYAGSNKLKEVGWYERNSHWETKPVGLKPPNELGIFDMSGNVDEWCQDHWHDNYVDAPATDNPWLDADKTTDPKASRVVRGGSWNVVGSFCRVSFRSRNYATDRSDYIGFRVIRY